MRGLTLKQPWASLVAFGLKTVETRKWATRHRGAIAIHAGKTADPAMFERIEAYGRILSDRDKCPTEAKKILLAGGVPQGCAHAAVQAILEHAREVRGAVVAVADLLDVVPMHKDHGTAAWCERYPGAWAWLLDDIRRLEPLPLRGGLGLFSIDPALAIQFRYPEEGSL